jgi:tRNA-intron endonuclease
MSAFLKDGRIIIEDKKTASKLQQKSFGKKVGNGGRLELSLVEGLYLVDRGSKCKVYADLRERGHIVKTGFKFGAHFRVYGRGESITKHSKYLVHVVPETEVYPFHEVSRIVRLAHGVKKDIIFAVVDDEGDITYYKIERITP